MTTLTHASPTRSWFGFGIDSYGEPRKASPVSMITLGVLLPVTSLWGIYRIITTHIALGVWIAAAVLFFFTQFGVTLGNHRYWTHRGFKARPELRVVLAVASALSVQGSVESWVRTHRAHHRYSDIVGLDPHTPYEYSAWRGWKGLLWAQGLWLMFEPPVVLKLHPHHDISRDGLVQLEGRAFPYLALGQFAVLLGCYPIGGLNLVLIAGALRVMVLMTVTGFVNSVCHRWGGRAQDSAGHEYRFDNSRNNVLVALLAAGEGNHAWHHADPTCPRHGRRIAPDSEARARGVRRDPVPRPDATWRLIQLLRWVGLIYDVKHPKSVVYFTAAQCAPKPEFAEIHEPFEAERSSAPIG
jgi:stearoyl-CoA desaturase (delta-9 desaturase)